MGGGEEMKSFWGGGRTLVETVEEGKGKLGLERDGRGYLMEA